MFWIFNFNSRYYFKVGVETGGHDHPETLVVAPKQAEGAQAEEAAVPDGEGSKLKVVLGDVSLDVSLRGAGDLRQVNTPGSPAEGREADTASSDQEPGLLREVAEVEMELLSRIVNGVGIYQFLQQLLKHNSELARLLDVVIRGRNGIASYEQLRPVVEEVQKAFERNREVLVNVSKKIINSPALEEVLRSLKRVPEKLNSVADAVKEHIGGLERLMTAIFERLTKGLKIQEIHPRVFVVFLLLALGIIGGIEFTSSKVAYAQEPPVLPTIAPPQPTAGGPGQGTTTPIATGTPEPTPETPTPESTQTPTIRVETVTATPDGTITVTATVPVLPTIAPPRPTAGGPGQGTTTPEATATETPEPIATIIVTITPSPTATETTTSTSTATATATATVPPTEKTPPPPATATATATATPEKEETPEPTPTVTVQVVTPTGETPTGETPTGETPTGEIVFQIPPTATAVLLDRPPVRPPNTSGGLVEEGSQPVSWEALASIALVAVIAISIGAATIAVRANSGRKKQ